MRACTRVPDWPVKIPLFARPDFLCVSCLGIESESITIGIFLILIAVALAGNVILVGAFGLYTQTAWVVTLALIVMASAGLGKCVCQRWDGILIDSDNRISLSRFQLICWTVLLIGSLACIGIHNFVHGGNVTGALNIDIPPQIWSLLGLPAFTAITAAAIKDATRKEDTTVGAEATALAVQKQQGLDATPKTGWPGADKG